MSQQQLNKIVTDSQSDNELPKNNHAHKNSDDKISFKLNKTQEQDDNSQNLTNRERLEQRPPYHQIGFAVPPPYVPPSHFNHRFVGVPPTMLPKP